MHAGDEPAVWHAVWSRLRRGVTSTRPRSTNWMNAAEQISELLQLLTSEWFSFVTAFGWAMLNLFPPFPIACCSDLMNVLATSGNREESGSAECHQQHFCHQTSEAEDEFPFFGRCAVSGRCNYWTEYPATSHCPLPSCVQGDFYHSSGNCSTLII